MTSTPTQTQLCSICQGQLLQDSQGFRCRACDFRSNFRATPQGLDDTSLAELKSLARSVEASGRSLESWLETCPDPVTVLREHFEQLAPGQTLVGCWRTSQGADSCYLSERSVYRALVACGYEPQRLYPVSGAWFFLARRPDSKLELPARPFVRYKTLADLPAQILFERPIAKVAEGQKARYSVIIPTMAHGREKFLQTVLGQLSQQTLGDFEVLIVKGEKRQGRAINCAAANAEGDILITLDDDSELTDPDAMRKLVQALEADPSIGMAGGSNQPSPRSSYLERRVMIELPRRSSPLVNEVTDSDMAEHPLLAMRKQAFFEVGGENEWIPRGLDPYLRARFREKGWRVVVVPGVVYHHLPPGTLKGLLRQFYRNGSQSRFCTRFYPEWALDTVETHRPEKLAPTPIWKRALRLVRGLGQALFQGHFVYLACRVAYALGWVQEARRPKFR